MAARIERIGFQPKDLAAPADTARQCVALRYYEQLSDTEIAATLDLSEGSAKTHLRRGLAALKQLLEVSP